MNSDLVTYTAISPHKTKRTADIKKITIHHMAGNLSVESCGKVFQGIRKASANYGIANGKIALYVPEEYRSYASSNKDNDNAAITIEVSNSTLEPDWNISDQDLSKLIDLCVDICERYNIEKLYYDGTAEGSNLTMHCMFKATACPGPYLKSKWNYIINSVNAILGVHAGKKDNILEYKVKIMASALNIRKGPGSYYECMGKITDNGIYTITEELRGWGKLKSGAGWICLKYTERR